MLPVWVSLERYDIWHVLLKKKNLWMLCVTKNVAVSAWCHDLDYCHKKHSQPFKLYEERAQLSKETKRLFSLPTFLALWGQEGTEGDYCGFKYHNLGECISMKIIPLTCNFHSSASAFIFIMRQHLPGGLCEWSSDSLHRDTQQCVVSFLFAH